MTEHEEYEIGLGVELAASVDTSTTVGRIDVDLTLSLREGRYVCIKFAAFPTVDNIEAGVTGEALREVAIGELIEEAARDQAAERAIKVTGRRIIDEAGGLTPEGLEVVATAYRYGYAIGDSPTREVVSLLGLSRSKASRWIAEAREDGFLGETAERRPGGVRLGVEAARDRLASLEVELGRAEFRVEQYRKEADDAERDAADPFRSMTTFGLGGGAERIVKERRARLTREWDRVADLRQAIKQAREDIERAQEDE